MVGLHGARHNPRVNSAPPGDLSVALHRIAEVQARLEARGLAFRRPPPPPTTCCGRGCNGCVWEGWYDAVRYWLDEAGLQLA